MRTKKQIFMLLLALLMGIPTLSAQSKKEKKEQKKEAVKKLIESENYKIDVNTAMPMRGRSIPLTNISMGSSQEIVRVVFRMRLRLSKQPMQRSIIRNRLKEAQENILLSMYREKSTNNSKRFSSVSFIKW